MSHDTTAWPARSITLPDRPANQITEAPVLPTWLIYSVLTLASVVLMTLAGASAWLSYHAQVAYVLAHDGGQEAQARVWALLLDAGTAGVSLLRLYETLRRRPGAAVRVSLLGCIAASVTMNLLHAASRSPGGYLVAAVPPVMYAVFLEHLLTNLRGLLIADERRRSMWRTVTLWINFPAQMWGARRSSLRRAAEADLTAPEIAGRSDAASLPLEPAGGGSGEGAEQDGEPVHEAKAERSRGRARRGRGPGVKRLAFEAALTEQVRAGDVRLFSADERERNAAAYQAAASIPAPLSRGAARRYVVQALSRLQAAGPVGDAPREAERPS